MLGTHAAGFFKTGPKRLTGSMQADGEIVGGGLEFLRHGLDRLPPEINPLQDVGIGWAECRKKPVQT